MRAFQELLGIELPVIQAPMAGVQGSALAIAVSNAGGLGSLPCAMLSAEAMRKELVALRAGTDRPFNLNFFCHAQPEPDAQREARWRELLAPYFEELGATPPGPGGQPGRAPFSDAAAELVEEFRPAVVSFHFGLPAERLLGRVKASGAAVLACATTVEEARWLEERGADAVIAQGVEAGGHRGMFLTEDLTTQLETLPLVEKTVGRVRVPVIAAGGIADAAGVRAALDLGAVAAQIGTAYLLCAESTTSAVHRAALKSAGAGRTALTNVYSGRPARGIVNRLMRELGPMNDAAPAFPLAAVALGPLRARAEGQGDGGFSPLWCGTNAGGCEEVGAAELTRMLAGWAS
jgi:nitronate monooxygenase